MAAEIEKSGLRRPTASPLAKFSDSPAANFADSNPYLCTSSPDPTPPEPTEILMVSPPDSQDSVEQQLDDNVVFLTPPEHQSRLSFSSEDQNPVLDEVCSNNCLKRARVSDGAPEEENELKKVRVGEIGENTEHADDINVTELDGGDFVEDISDVNLAEGSSVKINVDMNEVASKGNAIGEGSSFLGGISEIGKIGEENGIDKTRQGNSVDGVAQACVDEKIGNRIQEIDDSTLCSKKSGEGPSSITGNATELAMENDKNEGNEGQNNGGLMDILGVVRILMKSLGNAAEGGNHDIDFLEIAKMRGITFPRPQWWLPVDEPQNK